MINTLDFQPEGDKHFFTRVNAEAGAPFYVEVSHIDPTAVGGFYTISAGQPLPNVLEQPRKVFLPFVQR